MKRKLALFDMDNTLTRGHSIFAFYRFGLRRRPLCILLLPLLLLAYPLYLLGILSAQTVKAIGYSPIGGMTQADLAEFYEKVLLPRRIPATFDLLEQYRNEGYLVGILSASAEAYVREFGEHGLCDFVIASPLRRKENGRYSPLPAGPNCAGEEKKKRLSAFLAAHQIEPDFENSVAYSDSAGDLPMLSFAATRFRVTKNGSVKPW